MPDIYTALAKLPKTGSAVWHGSVCSPILLCCLYKNFSFIGMVGTMLVMEVKDITTFL